MGAVSPVKQLTGLTTQAAPSLMVESHYNKQTSTRNKTKESELNNPPYNTGLRV